MNFRSNKRKVQSHAMMEAARSLEKMRVDQSQSIDIFRAIQDDHIWLTFQPMKALYGFYLKQGNVAGIGVNSKHPLNLQRFTAAHEYAHHVLNHKVSLDDVTYIERAYMSSDMNEVAADTFAAHFLMPPQLVNTILRRMGLGRNLQVLSGTQVYQLGLDMGVSYAATVNHLVAIKVISRENAETLRQIPPKQIKGLLVNQPLENSWADIWTLDLADANKTLRLRVYDDLKICLPENPTTGYLWTFDPEMSVEGIHAATDLNNLGSKPSEPHMSLFGVIVPDENIYPLRLISREFDLNSRPTGEMFFGGGGSRYFTVRTLLPGKYTLRLLERRDWEDVSEAIGQYSVELEVAPNLTGQENRGLIASQQKFAGSTILRGNDNAR